MWRWLYKFNGRGMDFVNCLPACPFHDYTESAKQALVLLGIIRDVKELDDAAAKVHYACPLFVDRHKNRTVGVLNCSAASNVAQHMYKCHKHSPQFVQVIRYVTFTRIQSH